MDDDDSGTLTTDITYGGKVLASIQAGQTATLACARRKMLHDVIVKAGSGSGSASVITDGSALLIKAATVTQVGDDTLTIE